MGEGDSKFAAAVGGSLLMVLLAAGCGGSVESAESKSDGAPVPIEQYEAEFASAICRTYADVCGRAGLPFDHRACVSWVPPVISAATQLDRARYDPALARRCIDSAAASASSGLLEDLFPAEVKELCAPLFPPKRTFIEATGVAPAALAEPCDATCTRAACIGRRASDSLRVCLLAEGLVCAQDLTCQPAKRVGESCEDFYSCIEGLQCEEQHCIEPHSTGPCKNQAYCMGTSECRSGQCVPKNIAREFCAGEF